MFYSGKHKTESMFPCPVVKRLVSDKNGLILLDMDTGHPQETISIYDDAGLRYDQCVTFGLNNAKGEKLKQRIVEWAAALGKDKSDHSRHPRYMRYVNLCYNDRLTIHQFISKNYDGIASATYFTKNNNPAEKRQQPLIEVLVMICKADFRGTLPLSVLDKSRAKKMPVADQLRFQSNAVIIVSSDDDDDLQDNQEFQTEADARAAVNKRGRPTKQGQLDDAIRNPPPDPMMVAAKEHALHGDAKAPKSISQIMRAHHADPVVADPNSWATLIEGVTALEPIWLVAGEYQGWYGEWGPTEVACLSNPTVYINAELLSTALLKHYVEERIVSRTVVLIRSFFKNVIEAKKIWVLNPTQAYLLCNEASDCQKKQDYFKRRFQTARPEKIIAVLADDGNGHYNCVEIAIP